VKRSNTVVYDSLGKLLYRLESEEVTYSPDKSISNIKKPVVTLYSDRALPEWRIYANQANLAGDNIIYLSENVILDSLANDSLIKSIETDKLSVNLNTQNVLSDRRVKLFGYNFTCISTRVNYNLRDNVANLDDNVVTKYIVYNEE
jgi:lipopolysaccharide export system protein LptC